MRHSTWTVLKETKPLISLAGLRHENTTLCLFTTRNFPSWRKEHRSNQSLSSHDHVCSIQSEPPLGWKNTLWYVKTSVLTITSVAMIKWGGKNLLKNSMTSYRAKKLVKSGLGTIPSKRKRVDRSFYNRIRPESRNSLRMKSLSKYKTNKKATLRLPMYLRAH